MKRIIALVAAGTAAIAATAYAAETVTTYTYDAPSGTYIETTTVYYDAAPRIVYTEPAAVVYTEPPIVVTRPPLTEDQRITSGVIDRIAADDSITGRVGVETFRNEVTLSGRVGSPWQAEKASRHAMNTPGVREVHNELRGHPAG